MSKKIFFVIILLFIFGSLSQIAYASSFNQNLSIGMTNNDVYLLQKCLNELPDTLVSESGAGAINFETNFFGNRTKQAVVKYQNKYSQEILAPVGLTSGTGFVGPSTRDHLNKNCKLIQEEPNNQNTTETTTETNTPLPIETREEIGAPVITSISPTEGYNGTKITLTGMNFDILNEISVGFSSRDRFRRIASNKERNSITFTLDEDVTPKFTGEINSLAQKLLNSQSKEQNCDKEITYRLDPDGGFAHNSKGERIVESIKYVNCKNQLSGSNIAKVNKVIDQFPIIPIKIHVVNKFGRSNAVEFNLLMEKISKFPR